LPPEVTLSGSSGVGVLRPSANVDDIFAVLNKLATNFRQSPLHFNGIKSFPHTEIRWLSVSDEKYFFQMHEQVANSTLPFGANNFPYQPHCTVHLDKPWTREKQEIVDSIQFPSESFVITQLAAILQIQSTRECKTVASVDLA